MKVIRCERGIALITALLFTMLTLVIVLGLLYMVLQNTKIVASQQVYRNAVEASYGGAEVVLKEIIPELMNPTGPLPADLLASFPSEMNMEFYSKPDGSCFRDKLLRAPSGWSANCTAGDATNVNPKIMPDLKFELKSPTHGKYVVSSKIVDTDPGAPYLPSPPGGPLGGGGVTASGGSGLSSGQHYVYRVEIIGERKDNPAENGQLSVLYEY